MNDSTPAARGSASAALGGVLRWCRRHPYVLGAALLFALAIGTGAAGDFARGFAEGYNGTDANG